MQMQDLQLCSISHDPTFTASLVKKPGIAERGVRKAAADRDLREPEASIGERHEAFLEMKMGRLCRMLATMDPGSLVLVGVLRQMWRRSTNMISGCGYISRPRFLLG